ncbi:MAG: replicative DNA helicase, partial [Rhodospirillaceae bacterium]
GGGATKFRKLDLLLGGLHKSDLIIIAARPSMGKTAFATNIAFNVAETNDTIEDDEGNVKPVDSNIVGFFSLEMSAEQLAQRILAEAAQIPSDKIRKGEMNQVEFDRLVQASQRLQKAPLYIDDTPALTVSALRTRARRLKRQHGGLGLIVVDYLQLLQGSGAGREQNRVQEVSEITRGLKTLAKELNVPVIALSQLSRAVEQREDKRPQLADLRESGSIEQDADVVMFIYREEYYLAREEPSRPYGDATPKERENHMEWEERLQRVQNRAEIIVAKQRHGPIDKVDLRFYPEATKFDNLEDEDDYRRAPGGGSVPF